MKIIGNIFKIITLIFLLISSSCGLISSYALVKEQVYPTDRASDGYYKGFDIRRDQIERCNKLSEEKKGRCIEDAWKTEGATEGLIIIFAIGGNICLLILISWWYFRRRKRKNFSSS